MASALRRFCRSSNRTRRATTWSFSTRWPVSTRKASNVPSPRVETSSTRPPLAMVMPEPGTSVSTEPKMPQATATNVSTIAPAAATQSSGRVIVMTRSSCSGEDIRSRAALRNGDWDEGAMTTQSVPFHLDDTARRSRRMPASRPLRQPIHPQAHGPGKCRLETY